ncbi:MAG: XRE family transcriptional regulator [Microthrixaceae bacterium]|nr:XRE family transcriptional regulator [Microthrixaceae bacterium]
MARSTDPEDIESLVRARLRSLRRARGWSLDTLAERSHLGASTISRVETGARSISLDVLVPLARALQVDLDSLLSVESEDDDVVIRPVASRTHNTTTWPLSRPSSPTSAFKVRLEPGGAPPEPKVHPGHDWFYVLEGRVRLTLGEREVIVGAGEAADFSTMVPHCFEAVDGPAELLSVFDREGQHAHLHEPR